MRHKYPKDIKQQCHGHGISYSCFIKRMGFGMSMEEALNTPLYSKGVLPEDFLAEQRICQRLKRGIPAEYANLSKKELYELGYLGRFERIMLGKETVQEFCKRLNLKTNTVYNYILRHSIEEALRHFNGERMITGKD